MGLLSGLKSGSKSLVARFAQAAVEGVTFPFGGTGAQDQWVAVHVVQVSEQSLHLRKHKAIPCIDLAAKDLHTNHNCASIVRMTKEKSGEGTLSVSSSTQPCG